MLRALANLCIGGIFHRQIQRNCMLGKVLRPIVVPHRTDAKAFELIQVLRFYWGEFLTPVDVCIVLRMTTSTH